MLGAYDGPAVVVVGEEVEVEGMGVDGAGVGLWEGCELFFATGVVGPVVVLVVGPEVECVVLVVGPVVVLVVGPGVYASVA